MTLPQALGFLAAGLVLVTFGMRTMVPMRIAAIASNLAFIAYGAVARADARCGCCTESSCP